MSLYNSQKIKWIGLQFGIFIIFLAVACANYHFYLTNEFTPGGDGTRIYPYLKYMEKVPEIIPLWQGHKHHGYPLLADPENHMPWNLLLNTESPYFNIHLNLVFFFLTTIFAFTCRSIARMLGMSQTASLAVGIITILSVPVARVFMHGSLTASLAYVLIFIAVLALMLSMDKEKNCSVYMLVPASILLGWCLVTTGYYFLIVFYIPAFILLMCLYLKNQEKFIFSINNSTLILTFITPLLVLFSTPILLPILDGIILSKTFATEAPAINITNRDLYNYYLNLWPFIILALIFARGLFQRYAFLFLAMASINYILILFDAIHFNAFFDLWTSTPILKNMRWQHPFRELSSISAAFCAGIFIDSCREKNKIDKKWLHYGLISGFVILVFVVAYKQNVINMPIFMPVITIIFAVMIIAGRRLYLNILFFLLISILMIFNFNQSPFGNRLYTTKNNKPCKSYDANYFWYNFNGYDKNICFNPGGLFSMVFMHDYRFLLSLLYEQEITAQRPHWIFEIDHVHRHDKNQKVARLMGIVKRPREINEEYTPFNIFDNWVVLDETKAFEFMKDDKFTLEGPIILSESPHFSCNSDVVLKAAAKLIKKTADSLTFHITTNKNCVILVPEIYHRDWQAIVDGNKTNVLKAFASMRGIALPSGEHSVIMRFVYRPFYLGLFIASGSLLLSIILIYFCKDKLKNLLT